MYTILYTRPITELSFCTYCHEPSRAKGTLGSVVQGTTGEPQESVFLSYSREVVARVEWPSKRSKEFTGLRSRD
jgi:hypothetical protein